MVLRFLYCLPLLCGLGVGLAAPADAALADWWPFGRKAVEEPIPDALAYTVTLSAPDADRALTKALSQASALVSEQKTPAAGLVGLLARARQDVPRLTAILYDNARYAAEVAITLNGRPLESIGPFDSVGAPVAVAINITAGEPFVFGRVDTGPLPGRLTPERLGLMPGQPARSSTILAAESTIANAWGGEGHPLVMVSRRTTVADHRARTLDVTLAIDPGPTANFGRVTVEGAETVNTALVAGRAGLGDGPYSSTKIKRAETRLRDLGVFGGVRIRPAAALDPDGTIPMTITVSERKPRVYGFSVDYSNTEGLGLETYWRHRNLFGGAEQFEVRGSISRLLEGAFDPDYRLATTFRKPGVFDPMTDFTLRLEGYRKTTDAYRVTAVEGEVGLEHIFSDRLTGTLALELQRSETVTSTTTEEHMPLTLTGKLDWDTRDSRLDPTEGMRAVLTAAPAYDFLTSTPMATFTTDLAFYRSFGPTDRFVLAGRIATASLVVDDVTAVASDRRIYVGGPGTVRGYAYQSIAPRDGGGNIIGGRSSFVASAEARYRLNDVLGLVAFVDAGNAYASVLPSLSGLKVGVGVGLRYLTAVGPIRFDVAVPLNRSSVDPSVAFYVGLGQAF